MPNHTLVIRFPDPSHGWSLVRDRVPVTLLCDLLAPDGPDSREICAVEALADDVRLSHPAAPATHSPGRSTGVGDGSMSTG